MSDKQPYQFFEDLPADQFAALVEDIRANGVRVPIEVDENGATLDGHQRLRAVKTLADAGVKVDYGTQSSYQGAAEGARYRDAGGRRDARGCRGGCRGWHKDGSPMD